MQDPKLFHSPAAAQSAAEPPKEHDPTMFCTQCGTRNPEDANYCQKCGRPIGRPVRPLDDSEFSLLQQPEDRVGDLLAVAFKRREQGDLDGAIRACAGALQVLPESTSAHSLMGMLFEAQGERDKAISAFERVLALNPGSIADREKLEQLRDATTAITPRKITSSQTRRTNLFDSPAGAAAAAVAVFLIVLSVGAWAVMKRDRARVAANAPAFTGPMPNPAAMPGANGTQSPAPAQTAQVPVFNNGWPAGANPNGVGNQGGAAFNGPNTAPAPSAAAQPMPMPPQRPLGTTSNTEKLPTFSRPGAAPQFSVPPARVLNPPQLSVLPRPSDNTVILPEKNGLSASELGPPPGSSESASRGPGKIEIIVSQDGGESAAPGTPATSNSSMDSRSRRAIAYQAQLEGDYRRAVREYLKSLDGAGDDRAGIHQQIGICYQRLDDKESALSHYKTAVGEFKRLIAAGRNVEASQSGLRACERSIKVLE